MKDDVLLAKCRALVAANARAYVDPDTLAMARAVIDLLGNDQSVYVVTNHEDSDDRLLAVCATPEAVRTFFRDELFRDDKGEDFWEKPLAAWDGQASGVVIGDYIIRIRGVQR